MIINFNEKYVPEKYKHIIINYTSKGVELDRKFILFMFIFNSIIIVLLQILNIYVSLELSNDTDSYVQVYNHLHNKESIILALTLNSYNNKNSSYQSTSNYISNILNNSDSNLLADKYTEFPLDLLTELNTLVNLEVLVMIILINILKLSLKLV